MTISRKLIILRMKISKEMMITMREVRRPAMDTDKDKDMDTDTDSFHIETLMVEVATDICSCRP